MNQADIRVAAARLERRPPLDTLMWAVDRFGARLTLATGFGPEGCVLVDLVARHRLPIDLCTLDTDLLFPETYAFWTRLEHHYGIRIRAVRPALGIDGQAQAYGPQLWERDPDRCCALRKVAPLRMALASFEAWIAAIRRDQTPARARSAVVAWDPRFERIKISPLARWTGAQVRAYLTAHDVPIHPLHASGYPSVGCVPCTTPVAASEPPRAGRWRGRGKTECGLHDQPR